MPKLVEATAARIRVPKGARDVLVFDTECPGFAIRKFATGKASFVVQYSCNGQRRRLSLGPVVHGTVADMRRKAKDVLAKARMGEDVQAQKQVAREKKTITVGDLVPRYLHVRESDMAPSYYANTVSYLTGHWQPLHGFPVEAVGRRDVVRVLDDIAEMCGKPSADRAKAAISGLYAWAIERGYCETTPVLNIRRRANGGGRERVLTESELANIWWALEGEGDYEKIVKLLILTAQRRSEIGDLSWEEIDFDDKQIELPGTRTKNRRAHLVPLSAPALKILEGVYQRSGREFLFGEAYGRGFQGWSQAKKRLDAKLPPMEPWSVHDIRRSVITHLAEGGIAPPHICEALANHISGHRAGVCGIYNRAHYCAEKRAALEAWGKYVRKLVAK